MSDKQREEAAIEYAESQNSKYCKWKGSGSALLHTSFNDFIAGSDYERARAENTAKTEGIKECIKALRLLQDKYCHEREWSHSRDVKFSPVELSDWLLINVLRPLEGSSK